MISWRGLSRTTGHTALTYCAPRSRYYYAAWQNVYSRLISGNSSSSFSLRNLSTTCVHPNHVNSETTVKIREFERSERALQASQLNLASRLGHDNRENSRKSSLSEIVRLLKFAAPESRPLCVALVCLLVSASISLSIPFSVGKIIDMTIRAQTDQSTLLMGISPATFYLAFAGILTTGACANYFRIIILRIVGERVISRLRCRMYRQTIRQNAEFFDANRVGDLISRLGSDTVIVGKSITQNLSDGLRSLVSGVAGLSLMGYVSLELTGLLALIFPPISLGAYFYGRAVRNISRKIQQALGGLTRISEEKLGNIRTAQAFAGEVKEMKMFNDQVRRIFELGKRESVLSATFFSITGLTGNLSLILLLYVGGGMVSAGKISVGDLTSFLMYTAYAGSSMFGLSGFYSELMKGVGAASRLFELMDREPTISSTMGDTVKDARGPIEFRNVHFSYPTRPALKIFQGLNFRVDNGDHVAIVAPSGAGKSTVAGLLLRFYNPTRGLITINNRDICRMNVRQLRRKIGYVGQEPVLFSGTIADNIAYGVKNATRSRIIEAARQANCEFISDFPDGLDTFVGAKGAQLSGGQKQRIAIARVLIKKPDIIILDEATSALDAASETLVNQALLTLTRASQTSSVSSKPSIISIAHRMSTIKSANRIICLGSDGREAEIGTFNELMSGNGAFRRLMQWQISENEAVDSASERRHSVDVLPQNSS